MKKNLDGILLKDIEIMRQRAGQSVDLDMFRNMFASGQCHIPKYYPLANESQTACQWSRFLSVETWLKLAKLILTSEQFTPLGIICT
jgi:hypothetical protein